MVAIRQKTQVAMALGGTCETHARTHITVRDVGSIIDEPEVRGGTNQGLTPTETLMASLIGCTNVISQRIAHGIGVEFEEMDIALDAKFDRRGVSLEQEIDTPFSDIVLTIRVKTNATPKQMEQIKTDLARFCPIAKVLRQAGTTITENWEVRS
jgi:putative redox protein